MAYGKEDDPILTAYRRADWIMQSAFWGCLFFVFGLAFA